MAAVEQAAMTDALFNLRLARGYAGSSIIFVGISIGSHAAEYPYRWVVHWIALWFGAGTTISMMVILHYAIRRAAAVQPGLAAVQPGVLLGYAAGVLGAEVGAPVPLAPQPAGGGHTASLGRCPACGRCATSPGVTLAPRAPAPLPASRVVSPSARVGRPRQVPRGRHREGRRVWLCG